MSSKRPGVILADNGVMLIEVPDTPAAKATPKPRRAVKTVAQAAAKRPRLVRTPTPVNQVVKSVISMGPKPWKNTVLKEPDPIYKHFKGTGCGIRSRKTYTTYVRNLTTVRKICGGEVTLKLLQI